MARRANYTNVPDRILNRIERRLDLLDYAVEWINEREACELLGIKRSTLTNYISNGTIPPDAYSIGVGSNKFFDKKKLMGVK